MRLTLLCLLLLAAPAWADETLQIQEALDGDAVMVVLEGECEISAKLVINRPVVFTGGRLKALGGGYHMIEITASSPMKPWLGPQPTSRSPAAGSRAPTTA